jgi:hypothetical protein
VNAIPDKFARWDAANLLRARSPAEHREFEEHLASAPRGNTAIGLVAQRIAG